MQPEQFGVSMRQAAVLVEDGAYLEAMAVLRPLVDADLPGDDKAMVCVNLAVVFDKIGDASGSLGWYDQAIELSGGARRLWVRESKAAYLAGLGRTDESLAIYRALLAEGGLEPEAERRVRRNVGTLSEA